MDVGRITKVMGKYDGIISQSFSLLCRSYFSLFLFLGLLSGSPDIFGAALVLAPVANGNDFFRSLFSGSRVGGWLRISLRLLRGSSRGTWWNYGGVGNDGGGSLQKNCYLFLGFTPRSNDLLALDPSKKEK
jgi:hypothetical protein